MKGVRVSPAVIALGTAIAFVVAIVWGYLIGQTSFRPGPPSAATAPNLSLPLGGPAAPASPGGSQPRDPGYLPPPAPPSTPGPVSVGPPAEPSGPPDTAAPPPPEAPTAPSQPSPAITVPPSEAPTAPKPPSVAPGPTATPAIPALPTRFHVQVGVFDDRDNAEVLTRKLRSRGYAVTLVEGPPYRVWVGGYLDRATAERLAGNLTSAGFEATLSP